jgi:hypothetical protein
VERTGEVDVEPAAPSMRAWRRRRRVLADLRKRGKRESKSGSGAKGVGELGLGLQDAARVEALKERSMHGIHPIEQVDYVALLG